MLVNKTSNTDKTNCMRLCFYAVLFLSFFTSCKKEAAQKETLFYLPKMAVKTFEKEISKRLNILSLDVDNNGFGDVTYQTYYNQDMNLPGYKLKFYASGSSLISFPLNANSQDQETLPLKKGDVIDKNSFAFPYQWTHQPFVLMATKAEPYFNKPIYWEGAWREASHIYQGFKLEYPTGVYYGWVELSFDTAAERLMIHKAAMSTELDKGVKAGFE